MTGPALAGVSLARNPETLTNRRVNCTPCWPTAASPLLMCWLAIRMEAGWRGYTAQYPHEVAGLVLVDTGQLYRDSRYPPEVQAEYAAEERMIQNVRWLAPLGIVRLL